MSKPRRFTASDARKAYAQTGSLRAAGVLLGCSGERVWQLLRESGGVHRPLLKSERELLQTIADAAVVVSYGATTEELAEKMGIDPRAMRYRLARLRRRGLVTSDVNKTGHVPTAEGLELC